MANTPKKIKDPTEAALSAIQDALSARDAAAEAQAASPPAPPVSAAEELQWPGVSSAPDADGHQAEGQIFSRRAANDDRESIGNFLRALQRRPAGTSYVTATVFAGVWVLAGLVLGWIYLPEMRATLGPTGLGTPVLAMLAVVFFVPIIFFYVLAHMAWRSQELRLITQSMADVAMRLAEPETVARESIVTVGQAIRREVAAMGDGVERALARAAELETMVGSEVSALEHAYSENEVRIRALLHDLSAQRDSLVGQAGQIRDAINSVHLDLSHDISQVSELVAEQVDDASRRITHALSEKAEHITRALGNAGDTMIQTLGERGGDLLSRLESTSRDTAQAISAASDRLATTLNFKTDHIGDEFGEITANIQRTMSERLDRVTDSFAQKATEIIDIMGNRSQEVTELVIDTGNQMAETISSRIEEVNTTLKNTGDSLVLDLSLRGGDVVSNLEQTAARISDTIVQRGNRATDQFQESAEALAEVIAGRGEAAHEMLAARLRSFEDMFNRGGNDLAETIAGRGDALRELLETRLQSFEDMFNRGETELAETIA